MDSRGRPTTEGGGALTAYPIREKGDSQPSTPTDGGWASASERARSDQSRPSTLGTDSRPNTHGSGNIPIIVDVDADVEGEGEKSKEGGGRCERHLTIRSLHLPNFAHTFTCLQFATMDVGTLLAERARGVKGAWFEYPPRRRSVRC